jgi:hypothetical protein
LAALSAVLVLGVPSAMAAFHGVAQTKQCASPTKIGDAYTCLAQILNVVDTGHDTIRVTGLSDTVNAAGGGVTTGNILSSTGLVFNGAVTCIGGTGAGTVADPYIGATECLLPFGSSITTKAFSHYTVQAADFNIPTTTALAAAANVGDTNVKLNQTQIAVGQTLIIDPAGANPETRTATAVGTAGAAGTGVSFATPLAFAHASGTRVDLLAHRLTDTLTWNWNNTCTFDPDSDCTNGAQIATAGASTIVQKLGSSTATDIHNAAHQTVTVVDAGSTVHDFVTVSGQPGSPNPTGNVSIDWFLNGTCDGAPAANSGSIGPLNASGQLDATGFAFTVNSAGHRAFRATYLGDATYDGSVGACEPLTVVDANIQLTPPTATNHIGSPHVLTCHINVNDGNGFTNAPAGTVCTVSIIAGPGGPTSQNCATDATGSCQVTINSNATGASTIRASTDVAVAGLSIHRQTGDAHVGDSVDAQKLWVNAAIVIAPSATNEINAPHTFTVTVLQDTGSGLVPVGAGVPCNVTLTNGGAAAATPAGPFNLTTNASGQCSVTFTSATAGTVTGHASSVVTINGLANPVETNGVAPNSANAVKTFVDANISLTPGTDTDPVGDNHVLTCHINVNTGGGAGYVAAPDGTICSVNIASGPGSFVGSSSCATTGGTCTVTITSATTGTTTIHATTTLSVGGVSLTRATGDAHVGDGPNATKNWAGARISIAPSATNEIGQPHTFTVTVEQDTGSGFVPVPAGTPCNITLTNGGGAVATPAGPFNLTTNASGQCSVTFTSNTTGTVTGHASSTLSIGGQSVTVQTNGVAPNSADAVKTFVNAKVAITPATANNPVGTNHVLTLHVDVDPGTGFVNAPAGTSITASIQSGPGSFVGSPTCLTVAATGSCTVTITSATTGTTVVRGTTTVSVGGVSLTRTTGDAHVGDSADAGKNWADDTVRTDVHNASHNVITSATSGDVVHDKVFVAKAAGTPAAVPNPTGNVVFHRYATLNCSGASTDQTVALAADGTAESAAFTTTTSDISYQAVYSGDANYPGHTGACEPLHVEVPGGLIAPTQTTCSDVLNGTADVLGQINYPLSGGKIGQGINPGVFFFYSKITTTVPNQVVTVSQSNTSTNNTPLFGILNGQAWLWSGDCSSKLVGSTSGPNASAASFTVPTPGSYIIGIKYQTKTIVGANAPVPADITYNFSTSLGGATGASVLLKKQ